MTGHGRLEQRVARAAARAAVSGRPSVVTVAAPAQESDALAIALEAGPPFAYWEMPERGFAMAGRRRGAHDPDPGGRRTVRDRLGRRA